MPRKKEEAALSEGVEQEIEEGAGLSADAAEPPDTGEDGGRDFDGQATPPVAEGVPETPDSEPDSPDDKPARKRKAKAAEKTPDAAADEKALEKQSSDEKLPVPAGTQEVQRKKTIFDLDLNALDRGLSPVQMQEWNSIYASYRSKSILTGPAIGVDQYTFKVGNDKTGEAEVMTIDSLIVIDYRVKILIPETELWMPGEEHPPYVLGTMVGSTMDYVVLEIDREGGCAVASRRMALTSKRYYFSRGNHREGDRLTCKVMAVGPKHCTVECNGFDMLLTQRDLSYTAIPDLREKYRPGMELPCILKKYDSAAGELVISVKDTMPHPFEGADMRHPVGSRRQAVISGKYRGGLFCTLPDGTVCHCLYASRHSDADFRDGDSVIILIREYNYEKQQIFGRILSKW